MIGPPLLAGCSVGRAQGAVAMWGAIALSAAPSSETQHKVVLFSEECTMRSSRDRRIIRMNFVAAYGVSPPKHGQPYTPCKKTCLQCQMYQGV
jgi:hypothetical protein